MSDRSAPRPERRLPSVRSDVEAWGLVVENDRLVWWAIGRWFRSLTETERDDAYGYGIEGLFRAAQLWEPRRGRFSTYATAWIRQKIERGMMGLNERRAADRGDALPDRPLSLDVEYGNGDGEPITLGAYLRARDRPDVEAEWNATLADVARGCTPRERALLDDIARGEFAPLREFGERFGVSGEQIRKDRRLLKRRIAERVA